MTPDQESAGTRRTTEVARLLVRARAGDRHALYEIAERLMPLVWNTARGQGLDAESAMDVAQDTWKALLANLNAIRTPEALAAWLVKVTRHGAWRAQRERRRGDLPIEPAVVAELLQPAEDPETAVVLAERDRCLWENLSKLPPRCQELLRIIAFLDRPDYDLQSERLGMPKGSIGPTRGRCLAKLRKLLDDDPRWSTP